MFGWDDPTKLAIARCRLLHSAKVSDSGKELDTLYKFSKAFLDRYAQQETEIYGQLASCRQGLRESVRDNSDRFRHLFARHDKPGRDYKLNNS